MGRKVHPYGFRLRIIKPWRARWFAEGSEYGELLAEDLQVRRLVRARSGHAGIGDITIERFPRQVNVTVHTAKPGIVIGKKGAMVNELRDRLRELTGKTARVDVVEIGNPEMAAAIIAESIANQLERRISHKRAMKQAGFRAMRAGAQGIKIVVGGRLSGAEMARTDRIIMGRVPRHTLRADIDYAQNEALTTYGRIGVKCWVYKGEILPGEEPMRVTDAAFANK
jgi:small subunit ribosomal protein S3